MLELAGITDDVKDPEGWRFSARRVGAPYWLHGGDRQLRCRV